MAVPFLSDAAYYDLLGVLVKQSRPAHTRLALPGRQGRRALKSVGLLPNLLEQAGSEGIFAHYIGPKTLLDDLQVASL